MIILDVPEMHCTKCVERISEALSKENLQYKVSLEEKTVTIDGCEKCASTAINTLEDLGFEAKIR
ncbi:MAG: heavy-metal-associated domain-containing protein [Spirochaetaceae bacterium]|nr:heavy-metal-associated domain-containing protein [Spirochaetaceae bacterium]MBO5236243.1 heavy-metal-associated domain-containing protein [Spirochaetaceae bacterium]